MKLIAIVFLLLATTIFRGMLLAEVATETVIEAPVLDTSTDHEFTTIDGCDAIVLCMNTIGDILYNIGVAAILFVVFAVRIIAYFAQLALFVIELNLTPFPGTPAFINLLLYTPLIFLTSLLLYTLFRKGDA